MLQAHGDEYSVHDLLLDFAKKEIEGSGDKESATSRQAQYLGRLDVFEAYSKMGGDCGCHNYKLMALWRSVEELSGDKELAVKTYNVSLDVSPDERQENFDMGDIFYRMAKFFYTQVGCFSEEEMVP